METEKIIRTKISLTVLAVALACPNFAIADVLHVPANYSTIQAAVNDAVSGDEIKIAAGVYTNQVVITNKSLTLTGSPGTVLRATPWMEQSLRSVVTNAFGVPLLGAFQADVVVSRLTFEGERLGDEQPGDLIGIWLIAASGRVENCRIIGFRGATLGTQGKGVWAVNPNAYGTEMINFEVLRCDFADNGVSIRATGDHHADLIPPVWFPDRLSTTFAINDNTIAGNGPDSTGQQIGIHIWAGAGGEVKRNVITDHAFTGATPLVWSFGVLANDELDFQERKALAALQPIRLEGNDLRNNQLDLCLLRGDGSTVVNNSFQGRAPGYRPAGLFLSGENVLVATNRFSDLETGMLLIGNDPDFGTYLGIASNAVLVANGFCNVDTNYIFEELTSHTEQGTLMCPGWPAPDIQAVLLSWPYSYNGYQIETAPAINGPWLPSDATPFKQDGENRVVMPAESTQQFFRLHRP